MPISTCNPNKMSSFMKHALSNKYSLIMTGDRHTDEGFPGVSTQRGEPVPTGSWKHHRGLPSPRLSRSNDRVPPSWGVNCLRHPRNCCGIGETGEESEPRSHPPIRRRKPGISSTLKTCRWPECGKIRPRFQVSKELNMTYLSSVKVLLQTK